MSFTLASALVQLENSGRSFHTLLEGMSEEQALRNEGETTWNIKEVVAHLLLCEQTNWLPRLRLILSDRRNKVFVPIDMQTHLDMARTHSLKDLLVQFTVHRTQSLEELKRYDLQEHDLAKTGVHPVTGEVTLANVMATWVTHDLSHLIQVSRILALQNKEAVGSFRQYLKILH